MTQSTETVPPKPPPSLRRRLLRGTALIIALAITALVTCLLLMQENMIYRKPRYDRSYAVGMPQGTIELESRTGQGRQVAFYLPAEANLHRLLVFFGGNGQVALSWFSILHDHPKDPHAAYLLVDYPGYGLCEGHPKPATIRENAMLAFEAVAKREGLASADLAKRTEIVGGSLGAAVALDFARGVEASRLLLFSPFTSLRDMAGLKVGTPLKYLLLGNFDNRAALAELSSRRPPPRVEIIHGTADTLVPFAMGDELARAHPGFVTLTPKEGCDHNDVLRASHEALRGFVGLPTRVTAPPPTNSPGGSP